MSSLLINYINRELMNKVLSYNKKFIFKLLSLFKQAILNDLSIKVIKIKLFFINNKIIKEIFKVIIKILSNTFIVFNYSY
jgi:hypothetical protein